MMKRREFITLLGGAAAVWPLAARTQPAARLPTIGLLGAITPAIEGHQIDALMQRLRELGWIGGRNVAVELRWAEGRNERFADIVAEFDALLGGRRRRAWVTVRKNAPMPLRR